MKASRGRRWTDSESVESVDPDLSGAAGTKMTVYAIGPQWAPSPGPRHTVPPRNSAHLILKKA